MEIISSARGHRRRAAGGGQAVHERATRTIRAIRPSQESPEDRPCPRREPSHRLARGARTPCGSADRAWPAPCTILEQEPQEECMIRKLVVPCLVALGLFSAASGCRAHVRAGGAVAAQK